MAETHQATAPTLPATARPLLLRSAKAAQLEPSRAGAMLLTLAALLGLALAAARRPSAPPEREQRYQVAFPAGEGELFISTIPWSHVFIDGKDSHHSTPVRNLRVTTGPHRIELRTDEGAVHVVNVEIRRGVVTRIIHRF